MNNKKDITKNLIMLVLAVSCVIGITVPMFVNTGSRDMAHELSGDYIQEIYTNMFRTSHVTDEEVSTAINAFNRLPGHIKGAVQERCGIYLYDTRDENDPDIPANWAAFCTYPTYTAFYMGSEVVGAEEIGDYYIDVQAGKMMAEDGLNLVHEVGHFVDKSYKGGYCETLKDFPASQGDGFDSIYAAEQGALADIGLSSRLNVYTPQEFFAQGFACYFYYNSEMRERCPQLTGYIEQVIATYDGAEGVTMPVPEVPDVPKMAEVPETKQEAPEDVIISVEDNKPEEEAQNETEEDTVSVGPGEPVEEVLEDDGNVKKVKREIPVKEYVQIRYKNYVLTTTKEAGERIMAKYNEEIRLENWKKQEKSKAEAMMRAEEQKLASINSSKPWYAELKDMILWLLGKEEI